MARVRMDDTSYEFLSIEVEGVYENNGIRLFTPSAVMTAETYKIHSVEIINENIAILWIKHSTKGILPAIYKYTRIRYY